MATTFDFTVSCERSRQLHAESVLAEALKLVHELEGELSEFLEASPIHQLNHSAPFARVPQKDSALFLLERSRQLATRTNGAFNVYAKSAPAPKADAERVAWDSTTQQAWRTDAGARVGFGAIGKGYALDRVRELLERENFRDFILSAGGSSLIISGLAGPNTDWEFGWSWKKSESGAPLGIRLKHSGQTVAIGVSGTHEKGQHILGVDMNHQLKSALVALPGASAADADALSTALFVSGWEKNQALASNSVKDCGAEPAMACIDAEDVPAWNGVFHKLWGKHISRVASLVLGAFGAMTVLASAAQEVRAADDSVDLGSMGGGDAFTPYIFDRNKLWILLPAFALVVILTHLRSIRRNVMKPTSKKNIAPLALIGTLFLFEQARAVEIEPMGKALQALLKTTKVKKKALGESEFYYAPGAPGSPTAVAAVEHGLYQPNCTHTWAIGLDPSSGKVTSIRVIEMECQHAFPTKTAAFMDQYKGKGPADMASLDSSVTTIAKATGTCNLLTAAVKRAVTDFQKAKGQM